jgi:anthranilate synthase/aminodeoxychorismate synthase-like glutamine amidotransferase
VAQSSRIAEGHPVILLIDNYDSFVHNLARYFERLDQETLVVRNDETTPAKVRRLKPQAIVLSPGPCTPNEAGCSVGVVRELSGTTPILGVCLGHQAIVAALGGRVVPAAQPRHGRASLIEHDDSPLFSDVPSPFAACRYHSLAVDEHSLPPDVRVSARAVDDGCIMALEHVERRVFGVQFHPEAVLTEHGYQILANFLRIADCRVTADPGVLAASECRLPAAIDYSLPARPVTF